MATTNTRYIDVDADAGGNGTTTALTGGSCAYKSLSIWEAARQADLPTGDIIEEAVCQSTHSNHTADTTAVTIAGWTTDSTRYWRIKTSTASKAGTAWSASKYRIVVGPVVIDLADSTTYGTIDGLQVHCYLTSNQYFQGIQWAASSGAGDITIKNCHVKCTKDGSTHAYPGNGISCFAFGTVRLQNNIVYGFSCASATRGIYDEYAYVYADNNTVYGCDVGIVSNGDGRHQNNISYNNTTDYSGTFGGTPLTNLSKDSTSPNSALRNKTITFVSTTGGSEDFALVSGDTDAINAGTDLSATFTTDITGTTRPTGAGTWDIGAFEYVSAATYVPYPFSRGARGGHLAASGGLS